MSRINRRTFATAGTALVFAPYIARADKKYDPGVTDKEIKLGHTNPYSGPLSAYGTIGKAIAAYWQMVNDKGGINGRKITFISYDDGFVPSKTVEMVRKLVESDQVFAIYQLLGTPTNTVVQKYLNQKKVPQLFVATGASKWGDPKHFPWTMGWQPDYATEGAIYAKHVLATHKDKLKDVKIGILYQNDDSGKDYSGGFLKGLGKENEHLVSAKVSYEVTDPTVDSQIIEIKNSGANVFFNDGAPKAAAQAIRKAADLGWKPVQYLANVSASVAAVLKPAGFENSKGIITAAYLKDATDPQWADYPDFKEWQAWMKKYLPEANPADGGNVYAYAVSATMQHVLAACGDELTRANLMKQAASMRNLEVPMLLPGIKINTSPTDFYPIQSVRLARFDGEKWSLFGDVLSNESS
ncbi:ABC transporter substrate-binding protein [Enhydrobacter sp.]|jgi:branched-chain amino acid transport system substrate-binding protein|uniref:ABC transporter substrate-binding protein n=1 Tax=Enhydrobacter sp. TaxID=1894999 RepID=UPI002602912A|nr:ABC transporter substrate-binding protein [Enhydrobacter sp.]WIM11337.1 MAG: ABC transporter, substrate-binding protein BBta_7080 family [Enhydrobacter sp.]